MATNTKAVRKRIYAGLYLLARKQIHALSLGLGQSKKELVRDRKPKLSARGPAWQSGCARRIPCSMKSR